MKHRKAASQCVSDQGPVTFIDVVSCFSEEEWKLLHHWQKELYRNVMKDIHQALLSLGPMIANSVFSLKPKGHEELCDMDIEDIKLNRDLNTFQGYSTGESNAVFRKKRSAKQHLKDSPDTDERGSCDMPSTGPMIASSVSSLKPKGHEELCGMDIENTKVNPDLNTFRGDSTVDSNAAFKKTRIANEHLKDSPVTNEKGSHDMPSTDTAPIDSVSLKEERDVETLDYSHPQGTRRPTETTQPGVAIPYVPMGINEEGETYPIDIQDYGKSEGSSSYVGDEDRTLVNEESVAYDDTSLPCKESPEIVKMILISETASDSRSGKCSARNWSLRGMKVSKLESDFGNNTHSSSYQGIRKEYVGDNNPKGGFTGEANAEKTFGHNVSPKCNYQCKECKKSFRSKGHLICHERTHSGEKPYPCSVCDKSFSQRHRLIGHERTHSGEKPFQCAKCTRTFTWRDSLYRHHRTHTGERPYQCATCMKCFGQKETLVKHMEIHTRHKQD